MKWAQVGQVGHGISTALCYDTCIMLRTFQMPLLFEIYLYLRCSSYDAALIKQVKSFLYQLN